MNKNLYLSQEAFYRSLKQNTFVAHTILLGAGASIESGVQSATDCIWEWKRDIYITQNPLFAKLYHDFRSESVQHSIQQWLDQQSIYPQQGDSREYSFYAEHAYSIPSDRQRYFQTLINGKEPSLGYHILCYLAMVHMIKSVWTTNFDGLMPKAAYLNNLTPIEISLDTHNRLYKPFSNLELPCIALHGDYKFGPMKNTEKELDSQNDVFTEALIHNIQGTNMIVLGYSGRDKSLMDVFKKAFFKASSGRLYWCGYGNEVPQEVEMLITSLQENGKEAFYVPTSGFDITMLNVGLICAEGNKELDSKLKKLQYSPELKISSTTPFAIPEGQLGSLVQSNLFPFSYPQACFQFEIKREEKESVKEVFKSLFLPNNIIVSSGGGNIVYAWGRLDDIFSAFKSRLNSKIIQIPIPRPPQEVTPVFKSFIKKSLTIVLANIAGLSCNYKNRIWDESSTVSMIVLGQRFTVYKAIEVGLYTVGKFFFFSILPTYQLPKNVDVSKEMRLEIARKFFLETISIGRRPNVNFDTYINEWRNKIWNGLQTINIEYPQNSGSGFVFKVRNKNLFAGINKRFESKALSNFPEGFTKEQLMYNGTIIEDPKLSFFNSSSQKLISDYHPMRGLVCNQPYDYPINHSLHREEICIGVICPVKYSGVLQRFLKELNNRHQAVNNQDYLIDYCSFENIYGTKLNIPEPQEPLWRPFHIPHELANPQNCTELASEIIQEISHIHELNPHAVIIVFIPSEMDDFTAYRSEYDSFDLHSFIKAHAVQNNIATQLLREKTIRDDMQCQIMWWLSLALYVKSLRTPWILSSLHQDTAFAGIGYGFARGSEKSSIVLGCSHIYNAQGQGLKYKLSPIDGNKCIWDNRDNPFLTEQEAFKVGVGIRELFFSSVGDLPQRVVIHKRTPFIDDEVAGFVNALKPHGIKSLDLLEICHEDHVRFVSISPFNGNIDNYPIQRGCCFPIDERVAYLYTHGITSSVKGANRKYYKGGTNIPIPLKIKKHYGTGDLVQIATEVLGLTKMNWNSFDLYSKLPCTIQSSSEIAKIGWMLSHFEGRTYDYRYFM